MKLLLDENLSRRLAPFLQEAYPDSTQVTLIGLERADDLTLWRYAHEHGFVIVTKDIELPLVFRLPTGGVHATCFTCS